MPDQPTVEQAALILALADAQARARDRISERLRELVRTILASLSGHWYDEKAVRQAAQQLEQIVRQAQLVTGDVTAAYLDHVFDLIGVTPPARPVTLPPRLRNVDPQVEWSRPAKDYRRMRLIGLDEFDAAEKALQRAQTLAEADVNLAMREAARQRLTAVDAVTGYRRIIHPEQSRSGTCGLCVVAADRIYRKADLLPMHDNCQCEVLPIINGNDPGLALNRDDLKDIYAKAGGTGRDALKKIRVTSAQHGELGPILVNAGHRFRTAEEAREDLRATA